MPKKSKNMFNGFKIDLIAITSITASLTSRYEVHLISTV